VLAQPAQAKACRRVGKTLTWWRSPVTSALTGQPWTRAMHQHGFRNFTNYRLRLLLYCGVTWQTQDCKWEALPTLGGVEQLWPSAPRRLVVLGCRLRVLRCWAARRSGSNDDWEA
jgi:hypothetical protein